MENEMKTISLCMIVKNEEEVLARCLNSVKKAVDEIIIVDTGSVDETKKIAKSFGAKVYEFEWIDDFSAARNYSFSFASCDYIIWLDADDVISPQDLKKLIALKKTLDGSVRQIAATYNVAFSADDRVQMSYFRERIFLREACYKWIGFVHEVIPLEKDCFYADFCVSHRKIHSSDRNSDRNLKIYEKHLKKGITFDARSMYYYARELFYNGKYNEAISIFLKFIDMNANTADKIGALSLLSKCYIQIRDETNALKYLFQSFTLSLPRPEICCDIANIYFINNDYNSAIFWYNTALSCPEINDPYSFRYEESSNLTPLLQLCVCHYKIGNINLSEEYNLKAELISPTNPSVLKNKSFFEELKKSSNN